jgi:hypothetical protein
MMEILALAGVLSGAAALIREVRLMMVEIRRWLRPSPPRIAPQKKEPSV